MPASILIVDDEDALRASLARALTLEGFAVRVAPDGCAALREIDERPPGAIVLDVAMPGIDGVEVTRRLRAGGFDVPICMLSARDEVADRVAGLRVGADDYLVKPFALEELVARLHALLRRRGVASPLPTEVGELRIDPRRREAWRNDRELGLTAREYELLEAFMRHPNIVLTRDQLLSLVWGYEFAVETNVVDVFVGYLRRKLEAGGASRLLHTVRGVGFILRP